jgi:hypothetical protein
VIGIRVEAQQIKTGKIKHTNSCYFTMVAKGDDDKPALVPPLLLQNQEEVKRFIEALHMKEIKQNIRQQMDDANSAVHLDKAEELLANERCEIQLKA